jgi:hypothetical protein
MRTYILGYLDFINEDIKKVDGEYRVYPKKAKKGETRKKSLGSHKTYKEALSQLRAIELSKNS